MKTIYSVTYRVNCEEINSLGLFNSIDDAKVAIALHVRGGSFDVYSAGEVDELMSEINYQLAIIYDDEEGERFFILKMVMSTVFTSGRSMMISL